MTLILKILQSIARSQKLFHINEHGENMGSSPMTENLAVGQYTIDFISAAGITYSTKLKVTPAEKFVVEALRVNSKTNTSSASFSTVVLDKDAALSQRKDYPSFNRIPAFAGGNKAAVTFELMEPQNWFIYVDGKLAAKHAIVIDEVTHGTTIRVESAGYYSGSFTLTGNGGDSTLDRQQLQIYSGIENKFKVFLFKKRPEYDKQEVTIAIGVRANGTEYKLTNGELSGYYGDNNLQKSSFWSQASAKISEIPASAGIIPALAIKLDSSAIKDELNGQVTDILWSNPDATINAADIFPSTSHSLSGRTIFIGHSYFVPFLDRSKRKPWINFGVPFAVVRVPVGANDPVLANAKRYSN